jgi:hypothetical protein
MIEEMEKEKADTRSDVEKIIDRQNIEMNIVWIVWAGFGGALFLQFLILLFS